MGKQIKQFFFQDRKPLDKRWFIAIFGGILLVWLGYYALEYPGICIPSDNWYQFEEYFTGHHRNWHPLLHTLLTNFLVFTIGRGSLVPYMLWQMTVLAAAATYSLYWINRHAGARFRLLGSLLWFALHPVFAFMSFTLTKDVLFSAFLLLLSVELAEIILRRDMAPQAARLHYFLLAFASLGVLALRNNGLLIVLLLIPSALLLARGRRLKVRLSAALAAALVFFLLMQSVLFSALRVEQPPASEALAIPLQQFGRVIHEGRALTEEEAAFLGTILPLERWEELYHPHSIDPVKFAKGFYGGAAIGQPAQFLRVWLGLLRRYPADFIIAALDETRMLWNPLTKAEMILSYDADEYAFQVQRSPLPALTSFVRNAVHSLEKSAVLHVFWSPAILFMAFLVIAAILLLRRQKERLLPLIPCLALWVSLMLTIPAGLLGRYIYAFFLCLPLFLSLLKPDGHQHGHMAQPQE